MEMDDKIKPYHYNHGGLECFDALRAALGDKYMGFLIGNVIKYCWRYEHKNGIEDLQKAKAYIDEAIKEMQSKQVSDCDWRTGKEVAEQIASRGEQHD
jgi:hypothetical protein